MATQGSYVGRNTNSVIRSIRRLVDREQRRTAEEREAFESFADEVRAFQPASADPSPVHMQGHVYEHSDDKSTRLLAAVNAYKSTVMDVSHFSEECDETVVESLAAEFGREITSQLVHGKDFTKQLKQAILVQIADSIAEQDALMDALYEEVSSVDTAFETVQSVRSELSTFRSVSFGTKSFGALDGYRARLLTLAEQCDDSAAKRQDPIQRQSRQHRHTMDVPVLQAYIYSEIDATYPVLSVFAETRGEIKQLRLSVESAMSRCPV